MRRRARKILVLEFVSILQALLFEVSWPVLMLHATNSPSSEDPNSTTQQHHHHSVTVTLPEYGPVVGRRQHGVDLFGGIPYAAPPVGNLRWAPPEPAAPWGPSSLDATQFGPDCWQSLDPVANPGARREQMSEDCLHLNVYTAAGAATIPKRNKKQQNLRPVMVWLHGGAFQQGGARRAEYDGRRLAERGVAVVTLNYRLGALGFLVSS